MLGFGSPILLVAGFIFGKWLGSLLTVFALSLGATLIYIFSNFYLKDLVKELKIESSVFFPGFIPNAELPELLNNSDIYISTSLSDAGIAASTAEAMACGVPVVVTDTGENCKWVKNGETGYLVPPSEPLRLAEVIKNMILKPNEIKKVGLAGRKIISDYNDYQTEMAKMENLYKLVF